MDWNAVLDRWPVWTVAALLVWAAWIDGRQLRVPNWLTYPMVLSGLVYNVAVGGWGGLGDGLLGLVVGLLCLMPLYAVGGMGAGDVKLMAGMGAWLGWYVTAYAFGWTAVVGAVMAVAMVLYRKAAAKHWLNSLAILQEWMTVRNPRKLAEIAAARKPTMLLLPYGIPICVGSIGYFLYAGLLY
jgi:prepilin peptidase CpaA